ncbi:MAG: hypothetical protein ACPGVJ_10055, partial [Mangrovicoccus sp.]
AVTFTQSTTIDIGEVKPLHQTLMAGDTVTYEFEALNDLVLTTVGIMGVASSASDAALLYFGPDPSVAFSFVTDGVIIGTNGQSGAVINMFLAAGDIFQVFGEAGALSSAATLSIEMTADSAAVPVGPALPALASALAGLAILRRKKS